MKTKQLLLLVAALTIAFPYSYQSHALPGQIQCKYEHWENGSYIDTEYLRVTGNTCPPPSNDHIDGDYEFTAPKMVNGRISYSARGVTPDDEDCYIEVSFQSSFFIER